MYIKNAIVNLKCLFIFLAHCVAVDARALNSQRNFIFSPFRELRQKNIFLVIQFEILDVSALAEFLDFCNNTLAYEGNSCNIYQSLKNLKI